MSMKSIDIEIQKYLPILGTNEKKSILEVIKSFVYLKSEHSGRISLEQYNKEIDETLEQVKAGNYITQQDLEKEMEKW